MKKHDISKVSMIAFLILLFGGLPFAGNHGKAIAAKKVWKLKIQSYTVPGEWDPQWTVPKKFTELVKKHTKGRVDMSFHPCGEMVGPREIWTGVSAGTIDGGTSLDIYEGGTHPEFCFGIGGMWSIDEFYDVYHAGAIDILNEQTVPENIRIIGYFPLMNFYSVSMKNEHIKTLEDFKRKKLRGMGGAANLFLKKVEAGIITLPMSEVPSALQTGVVEGIHTGMGGLYAMDLWDVAPYYTVAHSGTYQFYFLLNESIYQEFPKNIRTQIDAAQREWEQWYRDYYKTFWKVIKKDVVAKGIIWYELTPDEVKRWRELLTECSVEWVMKRTPALGRKLFGIMEKITGRKVVK